MSRNSTTDRTALIRLASTMPVGSPERRVILAGLRRTASLNAERLLLDELFLTEGDVLRMFSEDLGVRDAEVSFDEITVVPRVDPSTLEVEVGYTAKGTSRVTGSCKMVVYDPTVHDQVEALFGQAVRPLGQIGWGNPGSTEEGVISVRRSPDGKETLTLYWNGTDGYQVLHDMGGVTKIPAPVIPNLQRLVSAILQRHSDKPPTGTLRTLRGFRKDIPDLAVIPSLLKLVIKTLKPVVRGGEPWIVADPGRDDPTRATLSVSKDVLKVEGFLFSVAGDADGGIRGVDGQVEVSSAYFEKKSYPTERDLRGALGPSAGLVTEISDADEFWWVSFREGAKPKLDGVRGVEIIDYMEPFSVSVPLTTDLIAQLMRL